MVYVGIYLGYSPMGTQLFPLTISASEYLSICLTTPVQLPPCHAKKVLFFSASTFFKYPILYISNFNCPTTLYTLSILCDLIWTKSAKNGHGVSSCSNLEGHHRIFTWGEGEELFPIHGRLLAGNHHGRRIHEHQLIIGFPYHFLTFGKPVQTNFRTSAWPNWVETANCE